jgi:hypothetical protein
MQHDFSEVICGHNIVMGFPKEWKKIRPSLAHDEVEVAQHAGISESSRDQEDLKAHGPLGPY